MSRTVRNLTFAFLALALGLAALPAAAALPAGFPIVAAPFCGKTVYGFGGTSAEALSNALAEARSTYFVFGYTVLESRCDTIEVPDPTPLDPFHTTNMTLCWTKLSICGIRRAVVIP
jgi:hypothetical protein